MKTRKIVVAALAVAVLAFPAGAQDSFKVTLLNGTQILSATAPVPSGTMLLVKNLSDGSLTAVPAELVSSVSKGRAVASAPLGKTVKLVPASRLVTVSNSATASKAAIKLPSAGSLAAAKMSRTLARSGAAATLAGSKTVTLTGALASSKARTNLTQSLGAARAAAGIGNATTIFLGPTGGNSTAARRTGTSVAAGGAAGTALAPLSASAQRQIFVGDLPRLTPRDGLTAGMVTPTAGEVVIGPNGFPIPVTATTPASAVAIGPNGFPDFTANTATAASPVIGLNGFPLTAAGTVPTTSLTPATAATGTGVPVTLGRATSFAGTGAISVPATATSGTAATTSGAAPAIGSPR